MCYRWPLLYCWCDELKLVLKLLFMKNWQIFPDLELILYWRL